MTDAVGAPPTGTLPCTLVVYSYFDGPVYRDNLRFFLEHGLHDEADFVLAINGDECTVDIPRRSNLAVFHRENLGLDFAGWSAALERVDPSAYEHFLFLNCTTRGPFLPVWARGDNWTRRFTDLLDDDVKLVGTTINFHYARPHVQSMLLCMDHVGLRIAYDRGVFGGEVLAEKNAIGLHREIGLSTAILEAGFRIRCLMAAYRHVDWRRDRDYRLSPNEAGTEPLAPEGCFGSTLHPYELIFIKSNRGLDDGLLASLTAWHDGEMPRGPLADCQRDLEGYHLSFHGHRPVAVICAGGVEAGQLRYLAGLFQLWHSPEEAAVIGVGQTLDAAVRAVEHPRIRLVEGSLDAARTVEHVRALLPSADGGMVVLGGQLDPATLPARLEAWRALVGPGSYLVIEYGEASHAAACRDVVETWAEGIEDLSREARLNASTAVTWLRRTV